MFIRITLLLIAIANIGITYGGELNRTQGAFSIALSALVVTAVIRNHLKGSRA